jgi:hypothetical protein
MLGGLFAAMLAIPQPALALKIAMPNYQAGQKAVLADAVVVGKVTSIEADTVELETYPGSKEKAAFKIAIIKIETALAGAKNLTHIKVAFAPMAIAAEPKPGFRPIRPGAGPIAVTEGQEGIFFLIPQAPGSSIMKIPMGFDPIAANAANYKEELEKVQKAAAIITDPLKALKAEKLEDRQTAVSILGQKYRRGPLEGGETEQVAIPAEETKLILATILEADWKAAEKPQPGFDYQSSGPGMASTWGLVPGQYGIPKFVVKPGENYNTRWKVMLDTWAKTEGDKLELKKFVAKAKAGK